MSEIGHLGIIVGFSDCATAADEFLVRYYAVVAVAHYALLPESSVRAAMLY